MKTIIIYYLIILNLAGFLSMGIDKSRAKRRKWRIPEHTLLLIAALGGSIGSLSGMYLFHHKTRKTRFSVGVPAILFLQILLILLLRSILPL